MNWKQQGFVHSVQRKMQQFWKAQSIFKDLMKKYNIPTAAYENFTDPDAAIKYLETEAKFPIVLKADGLALGKGVLICNTLEEAKDGVKKIMLDKKFGSAGNEMVIEEFMTGREVSVLSFVDGNTIKTMTSAQDHKRAEMEILDSTLEEWEHFHQVHFIQRKLKISATNMYIRQQSMP